MKKYIGFSNIIDHFIKDNYSQTLLLCVRFFIDEMVIDSIQNCTELNFVVL